MEKQSNSECFFSHCYTQKRQNSCKVLLKVKLNEYTRNPPFQCFSSVLGTKMLKCIKYTLCWNIKQYYQKHDFFCVCFLVFNEDAKIHAKYPLWRNRIALPKTCISVFSSLLRTKTPRWMQSTLYGKGRKNTKNAKTSD